jgi:hypothetical protein
LMIEEGLAAVPKREATAYGSRLAFAALTWPGRLVDGSCSSVAKLHSTFSSA